MVPILLVASRKWKGSVTYHIPMLCLISDNDHLICYSISGQYTYHTIIRMADKKFTKLKRLIAGVCGTLYLKSVKLQGLFGNGTISAKDCGIKHRFCPDMLCVQRVLYF